MRRTSARSREVTPPTSCDHDLELDVPPAEAHLGVVVQLVGHDRDRVEQPHGTREVVGRVRADELVVDVDEGRPGEVVGRVGGEEDAASVHADILPPIAARHILESPESVNDAGDSRRRGGQAIVRAMPGSRRIEPMSARNRDPCAPSTRRWSNDRLSVMSSRSAISPWYSHG